MRHASNQQANLRRRWHEWAEVVESFARRRGGRRPRPEAYGRLHAGLIADCRALAEAAGPRRGLYERLLDLAQPWVGLAAFECADREILVDLWLRCRQAGKELGGRPWRWQLRRWAARLPAALLLAGAGAGGAWALARYGRLAVGLLWDESRPLWFAVRQFGKLTLFAAAVGVVALGTYLVMRLARD
jgi:hypothetical protein